MAHTGAGDVGIVGIGGGLVVPHVCCLIEIRAVLRQIVGHVGGHIEAHALLRTEVHPDAGDVPQGSQIQRDDTGVVAVDLQILAHDGAGAVPCLGSPVGGISGLGGVDDGAVRQTGRGALLHFGDGVAVAVGLCGAGGLVSGAAAGDLIGVVAGAGHLAEGEVGDGLLHAVGLDLLQTDQPHCVGAEGDLHIPGIHRIAQVGEGVDRGLLGVGVPVVRQHRLGGGGLGDGAKRGPFQTVIGDAVGHRVRSIHAPVRAAVEIGADPAEGAGTTHVQIEAVGPGQDLVLQTDVGIAAVDPPVGGVAHAVGQDRQTGFHRGGAPVGIRSHLGAVSEPGDGGTLGQQCGGLLSVDFDLAHADETLRIGGKTGPDVAARAFHGQGELPDVHDGFIAGISRIRHPMGLGLRQGDGAKGLPAVPVRGHGELHLIRRLDVPCRTAVTVDGHLPGLIAVAQIHREQVGAGDHGAFQSDIGVTVVDPPLGRVRHAIRQDRQACRDGGSVVIAVGGVLVTAEKGYGLACRHVGGGHRGRGGGDTGDGPQRKYQRQRQQQTERALEAQFHVVSSLFPVRSA